MTDFRFNIDRINGRMTQMLEFCEGSEDCFVHFFFYQLANLHEDSVEAYDSHIAALERKILELEKELIFANLPVEHCR